MAFKPVCAALFLTAAALTCGTEAKRVETPSRRTEEPAAPLPLSDAERTTLSGKFAPDKNENFAPVPVKYANGRAQYLEAKTLEAFLALATEAEKQGYKLQIVSGTRNFTTQKAIWEQKFSGNRKVGGKNLAESVANEEQRALEILRFSSMPGTSRHHWGTDMDLHEAKISGPALHNSTFKSGRGLEFYNWLTANAPRFGFCQPYTGDPSQRNAGKYAHGYQEERWHWSYRPVSAAYLKRYRENSGALKPNGYAGDKAAAHLYLDYVQNVDPECH